MFTIIFVHSSSVTSPPPLPSIHLIVLPFPNPPCYSTVTSLPITPLIPLHLSLPSSLSPYHSPHLSPYHSPHLSPYHSLTSLPITPLTPLSLSLPSPLSLSLPHLFPYHSLTSLSLSLPSPLSPYHSPHPSLPITPLTPLSLSHPSLPFQTSHHSS